MLHPTRRHPRPPSAIALLLAIASGLSGLLLAIAPAHAQLVPNPQDRRTPTGTVGGGTRGNGCGNASAMPFVNLSEDANAPGGVAFSVRETNPTLYVHLPEERPANAEFIVLDGSGTILERSPLTLPPEDAPGRQVLALPLFASSAQGRRLEPQKSYRWAFVMVCDLQDRGADRGVVGEVRLVEETPPTQEVSPRPQTPFTPPPRTTPPHRGHGPR